MTEPTHHLRGVGVIIGGWGVAAKVQESEQTLLVIVFKDRQAPLYDCVIMIQEVQPVAAVIQVIFSQRGYPENIFVAEGNGWEGHVVSPDHVDLGDSGVGHQIEDSIPGPGEEETQTKEEGHDPDDPLRFRLVWREDKLQTVDLGPHYEIHRDLVPCCFQRAGLWVLKRGLLGIT